MNSISVIGRLGRDPELKDVGDSQVAEFSLAETQYEGPNRQSTTGWYRCQVWGNRANSVMDYLYKGAQITVLGSLKQRAYTTKEGVDKVSMDIRVSDFSLPAFAPAEEEEEAQEEPQRPAPRQQQREPVREASREPVRQGGGSRQQPARANGAKPRRVADDTYEDDLDSVPF